MTAMKVTEENFIPLLCRKHEKALEYCMLHYGGLVKAVVSASVRRRMSKRCLLCCMEPY